MSTNNQRLESLDTLRGIAILMVIGFHTSIPFQLNSWASKILDFGNQGVQLFFLISAFTMCMMWNSRKSELNRTEKFYIRRFMRIAPLYWLAIVLYFLISSFSNSTQSTLYQIILNALFLHGFSPIAINSAVPGGWSIAVEMSFYALFPILALFEMKTATLLVLALISYLVLGIILTTIIVSLYSPPPIFIYYSLLTQFPIFIIGMVVYKLCIDFQKNEIIFMIAIALIWLIFAFVGKYAYEINTRPFFWLQIFLFALMMYYFFKRRINFWALSQIGTLSYSMYLFHFAIIDFMVLYIPHSWKGSGFAYLGFFAIITIISSLVGKLSHLTFERWSTLAAKSLVLIFGKVKTVLA
jgi:exopolysaccharide production protein ExoZ